MSNVTKNQGPTSQESDVSKFKEELIALLIEKIDGDCINCGRMADEPTADKCSFSEDHESFYWLHHPVDYCIKHYGIDDLIFDPEKVNSHIAEHEDLSRIGFALVFDGNGLFDYLVYDSPFFNLHRAIDDLAKKYGFVAENYHHWNLVFYRS